MRRLSATREKRCTEKKPLRAGLQRQSRDKNSSSSHLPSKTTMQKSSLGWRYRERLMEARLALIIASPLRTIKSYLSQLSSSDCRSRAALNVHNTKGQSERGIARILQSVVARSR